MFVSRWKQKSAIELLISYIFGKPTDFCYEATLRLVLHLVILFCRSTIMRNSTFSWILIPLTSHQQNLHHTDWPIVLNMVLFLLFLVPSLNTHFLRFFIGQKLQYKSQGIQSPAFRYQWIHNHLSSLSGTLSFLLYRHKSTVQTHSIPDGFLKM